MNSMSAQKDLALVPIATISYCWTFLVISSTAQSIGKAKDFA